MSINKHNKFIIFWGHLYFITVQVVLKLDSFDIYTQYITKEKDKENE